MEGGGKVGDGEGARWEVSRVVLGGDPEEEEGLVDGGDEEGK